MNEEKKVIIRLVRDDGEEFVIGTGGDWRIPSNGLSGFGSLDNNIILSSNAFGDGSQCSGERVDSKDRTVKAKVRDVRMNAGLRRKAISFLKFKHTYKVYVTYMGLTRWFDARISRKQLSEGNIYKPVELQFTMLSENPYYKSYDNFGKDIAQIIPMTGFPYMCTAQGKPTSVYNYDTKSVIVENDGDVDTYCKAIFRAKGTVVRPTLLVNGKFVRMLITLQQNDELILDFTTPKPNITLNGVNVIGSTDRTSDLSEMQLVEGENTIGYEAESGDNVLEVSIYYNKLYALI